MDDNILVVNYPSGRLVLNMTEFFPNTALNTRKLIKKVIGEIPFVEDRIPPVDRILEHLDAAIAVSEDEKVLKEYANLAVTAHTKAAEMQDYVDKQTEKVERMKKIFATFSPIEKKKHKPNLDKEKEILKGLKEKQSSYMVEYRMYKSQFNERQKRTEKLKKNRELIEESTTNWR